MFSPYLKRVITDALLLLAFSTGILYFKNTFLDFLISLFHFYESVNVVSIAYTVMRFIFIFIPIIMIASVGRHSNKNFVLRVLFIIIGVCYILGNTWIIYYLAGGGKFADVVRASIPKWFANPQMKANIDASIAAVHKYQYDKALVFNYIVWDTDNIYGILFGFIQGYLYIRLGNNLNGRRKVVLKQYIIVSILALLLPMINAVMINANWLPSSQWLKKNAFLIFQSLIMIFALKISSTSKMLWADVIW